MSYFFKIKERPRIFEKEAETRVNYVFNQQSPFQSVGKNNFLMQHLAKIIYVEFRSQMMNAAFPINFLLRFTLNSQRLFIKLTAIQYLGVTFAITIFDMVLNAAIEFFFMNKNISGSEINV